MHILQILEDIYTTVKQYFLWTITVTLRRLGVPSLMLPSSGHRPHLLQSGKKQLQSCLKIHNLKSSSFIKYTGNGFNYIAWTKWASSLVSSLLTEAMMLSNNCDRTTHLRSISMENSHCRLSINCFIPLLSPQHWPSRAAREPSVRCEPRCRVLRRAVGHQSGQPFKGNSEKDSPALPAPYLPQLLGSLQTV